MAIVIELTKNMVVKNNYMYKMFFCEFIDPC